MKSRDGKSQRREEKRKRREEKRREKKEDQRKIKEDQRREIQKKEDQGVRKSRKVAVHCVFPMICGSGGSKSRLAKAAGAEPCSQMRDEKLNAVVPRSTFASEKAKSTSRSEHCWKLWCRKCARCCGGKHISKSKCTKHTRVGPLLEVEMFKKSARCCGAKHISKSKVLKTDGLGPLLDVQMSFRMASARDCAPCQKWAKREGFVAVSTTTTTTVHSTPLHNTTTTTTTTLHSHYITLHYVTLHYITLRYITLHYTNYMTLRYTPLH